MLRLGAFIASVFVLVSPAQAGSWIEDRIEEIGDSINDVVTHPNVRDFLGGGPLGAVLGEAARQYDAQQKKKYAALEAQVAAGQLGSAKRDQILKGHRRVITHVEDAEVDGVEAAELAGILHDGTAYVDGTYTECVLSKSNHEGFNECYRELRKFLSDLY